MPHTWKSSFSYDGRITRKFWDCQLCGNSVRMEKEPSPDMLLMRRHPNGLTDTENPTWFSCEDFQIQKVQTT